MKTLCVLALAVVCVTAAQAQTYTESVLYSFGTYVTGSCVFDAQYPFGGLVMDSTGNLYGTTTQGGIDFAGTVFKISPTGSETILHCFTFGTDGEGPRASLTIDKAGNLYGTTPGGGKFQNSGTIFKVTPSGVYTVLHTFGRVGDGRNPFGPLFRDSAGNFYGTTAAGGSASGCGTVFKLSPHGVETILYEFTGANDGCGPNANLVRDSLGNFYGTTVIGGANNAGVVFKLTPQNVESVMYNFCSLPGCSDGASPSYIVRNSAGTLYGVLGGSSGGGIFQISTDGTESVLAAFSVPPDANGSYPSGPLLLSQGNLYGTMGYGGAFSLGSDIGGGAVYELAPSAIETLLYSFPDRSGTAVGENPFGGVIMDAAGNLYGTTYGGGANGFGAVFKLTKN